MNVGVRNILLFGLRHAPLVLLLLVFTVFAALTRGHFLAPANLMDILVGSAGIGIVACGMTVVLLTGGIDLSVGAVMFAAAAVAGKLLTDWGPTHAPGLPLVPLALISMIAVGAVAGAVNATLITVLRLLPFVVTLATLYIGRGFGWWLTGTRAINLPADFMTFGYHRILGVPFPVCAFASVVFSLHVLLSRTSFGIQLYAMGNDVEAARKAGIRTGRMLFACYLISGLCAGIAGLVSLAQLGTVSQTFGVRREFEAIAAAVVGGVSLFGGRGSILPGAVVGTLLFQTVFTGLVSLQAPVYSYPIITCAIIFAAVLVDLARTEALKRLKRRQIVRPRDSALAAVAAP